MANRWGNGRGGRPWRRLVEAVKLRDQYTCQACKRVTDQGECDHIIPQAKGGKDDMGNLQWLCGPCHEVKTITEMGSKPKVAIDVSGWPAGW